MSETNWNRVKISEVCNLIVDCLNRTAPKVEGPTPYMMIRTSNVKNGRIDLSDVRYVTKEVYSKWTRRAVPRENDVILTREAPLGEVGIIRDDSKVFLGQRLVMYRTNQDKLLPRFLLYSLMSHDLQEQIQAFGSGSTVAHMKVPDTKKLELNLPPIEIQKKVVSVLGTLDDLYEYNVERIKILEEIAKILYDEWFVHLRYPGYENAEIMQTTHGPKPEGWGIEKLSDLVDTQYGYTESAKNEPIGPKFLRGMDINKRSYIDWSEVPYCTIYENDHKKFSLNKGDILVIRMADPGKAGTVEDEIDAVFASYLVRLKIKSDKISPYYLYYFLLSDKYQGYISGASTGTTRKSASAKVLTGIHILIPSRETLERFERIVSELRNLLNILVEKNSALRRMRDLILPKLVSGEVDVSELNIKISGD